MQNCLICLKVCGGANKCDIVCSCLNRSCTANQKCSSEWKTSHLIWLSDHCTNNFILTKCQPSSAGGTHSPPTIPRHLQSKYRNHLSTVIWGLQSLSTHTKKFNNSIFPLPFPPGRGRQMSFRTRVAYSGEAHEFFRLPRYFFWSLCFWHMSGHFCPGRHLSW